MQIKNAREKLLQELKRFKIAQLANSVVGKKLLALTETYIPQNQKSLIDDKLFIAIEKEIKIVFPTFKSQILELHPKINIKEWQYCCLILFGLGVKAEANLLCMSPQSVRTKRLRLREKLNIELEDITLYEYFIEMLTNN